MRVFLFSADVDLKASVYVHLEGGLGNQLFQYAAARAFADRSGADLFIDSHTGFIFDRRYRRKFALGSFKLSAKEAPPGPVLVFFLLRLFRVRQFGFVTRVMDAIFSKLIVEDNYSPAPTRLDSRPSRRAWVIGYWQSADYFIDCESIVRQELAPPAPQRRDIRVLGDKMSRENSVAIGIRLYEETECPTVHCRDGRLKSPGEVSSALRRLRSLRGDVCVYVFCSHESSFIREVALPSDAMILTPERGFSSPLETLWLLSKCKHHIFTNSSFYWWGAWLSSSSHSEGCQTIIAADNFSNTRSVCAGWLTF